MTKYETVTACPMCGDTGEHIKLSSHPYYKCKCGMVYRSPRFSAEYLDQFYTGDEYRTSRKGFDDVDQVAKDEDIRAERIAKLLTEGKSILDVGCAKGHLLRRAKAKGYYDVIGVEPNAGYTLSGIPTAANLDDVEGEFDVITCIHTLEHIIDFKTMAERIKELLKSGGLLIVEVPSVRSSGHFVDVHISLFKPVVLMRLFAPLENEKIDYTPHLLMTFRSNRNVTG